MDIASIPTKRLEAAIDQLADADMRRLVELRYVRGLTVKAVALELGISRPSYYRRHQAARKALKAAFNQIGQARIDALLAQLNVDASGLVGVHHLINDVTKSVTALDTPWIISIEGIGGIGKTSLAAAVTQTSAVQYRFDQAIWISAKRDYWNDAGSIHTNPEESALTEAIVISRLLEQLNIEPLENVDEQRVALINRLKSAPYLVVIDNLETISDYETLLPLARSVANPSKILFTSRHSLKKEGYIRCFTINQLPYEDASTLLVQNAAVRGIHGFDQAGESEFEAIYEVVGGNPLALKLVVGQLSSLPLPSVLAKLREAKGHDVESLYTFIYWQAWNLLNIYAQQAFLTMPILFNTDKTGIFEVAQLTMEQLDLALEQLVKLSLVQVSGPIEDRHYSIHQLTESFLMNEVIKWQSNLR